MTAKSVLVVKPSSLGDVVHTLPAVALLKKVLPDARLSWLVNPEWAPLLRESPIVDETLIFPRHEFRGLGGAFKFARWLRTMKTFDLVLDFQGLLRSAIIGRACRGGELLGLSDAREGARFFYDRVVPVRREHAVDRYLKLVASLGFALDAEPAFPLPAGERTAGFPVDEPFVLLHPFARGAGKSLNGTAVAALCSGLQPVPVVLAGRTEEKPVAGCFDLLNRTSLLELIWLIRHASFVISVDSGPMHIAAALTDRLLAIHTWSDPRLVGPYNKNAWVWKDGVVFKQGDPGTSEPLAMSNIARFVGRQLAGPE
ncbi:MAG: glycosyltransferase family 9 protein [Verrucomicrobiota bacterium]|nr:glycosyltransferase family 9 protein [Verrucomicrobiota bacterium]